MIQTISCLISFQSNLTNIQNLAKTTFFFKKPEIRKFNHCLMDN